MEKVKLKLSNEEFKTIFIALNDLDSMQPALHLFPHEKIVVKEVMYSILEKQLKPEIKITITQSQAFILFRLLTMNSFNFEGYVKVIISIIVMQIEEQLYKKSNTGFEILKEYKSN